MISPFVYLAGAKRREFHEEPKSILVVEYWNLGDFVMLLPFLKNLRLHYPRARISLLLNPRTVPIAEGQGLVDELIPVKMPWAQHMSRWKKYVSRDWVDLFRCIGHLRRQRFDMGFAARADIRENLLLWTAGVERRVGYGFAHGGSLLTDVVEPDLENVHYSDRWLRLLEYLRKPILDRRPALRLAESQKAFAARFLRERGLNKGDVVVGIHAGARNTIRQWGEGKFLEVARRLRQSFPFIRILWFREPGRPETPLDKEFVSVALPLAEFLAVVERCNLLVCNDTGPMHMASGLGVPVVAVFGPTQPEWFAPIGDGHRIVIRRELWCRPCFDYCVFDQPYCLRLITVDSVHAAVVDALRCVAQPAGSGKSPSRELGESMESWSNVERAAD